MRYRHVKQEARFPFLQRFSASPVRERAECRGGRLVCRAFTRATNIALFPCHTRGWPWSHGNTETAPVSCDISYMMHVSENTAIPPRKGAWLPSLPARPCNDGCTFRQPAVSSPCLYPLEIIQLFSSQRKARILLLGKRISRLLQNVVRGQGCTAHASEKARRTRWYVELLSERRHRRPVPKDRATDAKEERPWQRTSTSME